MFVPGAKRASAAGLISDGAGRPGVGEAGGVGEGGGGVGEAGGVGEGGGGAPAVTVRLAETVVSKNAVMVTDVLFPTANVIILKMADVWSPGPLLTPGARREVACV